MSKVLITADVHFGYTNRLRDILWAMQTISKYAEQCEIDTIFVLGDLFHDRVQTNIEVMDSVYNFFSEVHAKGQRWIIFPGNHDMFHRNSWKINSLRPIETFATVIYEQKLIKIDNRRFFILPFMHYESVYMQALRELEKHYQSGDVLLTHIGVNNAILNECFLIKNWSSVQFEDSKFDLVFAGHFHCHQQVEGRGNVWYPGSPIPYNFAEGSVPHGFIQYDIETRDVEFIEIFDLKLIDGCPPDFITILDTDLEDDLPIAGNNVRVHLGHDYSKDELLRVRKLLEDRGALSVKWMKDKDEEIGLQKKASEISVGNPVLLFKKWLEHDKPKKLDYDLLLKLNEIVVE